MVHTSAYWILDLHRNPFSMILAATAVSSRQPAFLTILANTAVNSRHLVHSAIWPASRRCFSMETTLYAM